MSASGVITLATTGKLHIQVLSFAKVEGSFANGTLSAIEV